MQLSKNATPHSHLANKNSMKQIIIASFTVVGILLAVYFLTSPEMAINQKPQQMNNYVASEQDNAAELVAKLPVVKKPAPTETLNPVVVADGIFEGISRHSDTAKAYLQQAGVLPKDLNNEAYVEFDLNGIRNLDVGDIFDLNIPQTTESFSAEVTGVHIFPNGDKSVISRVIGGDPRMHTSVMTVGKDALYGQFTVTSGNYVFETKNQFGWIAAKRDLTQNHSEIEMHPDTPITSSETIVTSKKVTQ